jgi:glutamate/tyrosine decarboxylase-like PLP-dependent enzyme
MRDDLVLYVSDQAHSSIARSARILGFQPGQVRVLPTDTAFRLDPATLCAAMEADVAAGRTPFLLAANAGATNSGAVDPLPELAEACREHGAWLHVDAAYGGFAALVDRALLPGIELADSVTLDPHKWLYQPFECGCVLVRNGRALRSAFEMLPDYLRDAEAAAGEVNFSDLGLQLTRSARALKVWVSLRFFGVAAFREAIARSLALAARAAERVEASESLELLTPPSLGVVCFRRRDLNEQENAGLAAALERSGVGLVSSTRLHGRLALRLCVLNHTSGTEDVERVLAFLETAEPEPEAPQHVREAAAGETIVEQWSLGRDFYVILEGSAAVSIDGEHTRDLGPGEFFGELTALDWGAGFTYPRLASVQATSPLRLLVFPDGSLSELARRYPSVDRQVRAAVAERLPRHT